MLAKYKIVDETYANGAPFFSVYKRTMFGWVYETYSTSLLEATEAVELLAKPKIRPTYYFNNNGERLPS